MVNWRCPSLTTEFHDSTLHPNRDLHCAIQDNNLEARSAMNLTGYGRPVRVKKEESVAPTPYAPNRPLVPSPELTGEALRLLVKVDRWVTLRELPENFPRVLNRLAVVWGRPSEADRCFEELLMNSRANRQGFPLAVVSELTALRHFYVTRAFPKHTDPWEQMHLR
jgi:hypothetical protein